MPNEATTTARILCSEVNRLIEQPNKRRIKLSEGLDILAVMSGARNHHVKPRTDAPAPVVPVPPAAEPDTILSQHDTIRFRAEWRRFHPDFDTYVDSSSGVLGGAVSEKGVYTVHRDCVGLTEIYYWSPKETGARRFGGAYGWSKIMRTVTTYDEAEKAVREHAAGIGATLSRLSTAPDANTPNDVRAKTSMRLIPKEFYDLCAANPASDPRDLWYRPLDERVTRIAIRKERYPDEPVTDDAVIEADAARWVNLMGAIAAVDIEAACTPLGLPYNEDCWDSKDEYVRETVEGIHVEGNTCVLTVTNIDHLG